jgi:hypothetical protein
VFEIVDDKQFASVSYDDTHELREWKSVWIFDAKRMSNRRRDQSPVDNRRQRGEVDTIGKVGRRRLGGC